LLTHLPRRGLTIVWDEYMHDPAEARRSIRKLLDLPFSILCCAHGEPLTEDPKGAIRDLLERDAQRDAPGGP
jgi:glyoxylase-like metal-dependent hydrolase (beta-lactamase superfamily II)